MPLIKYTPVGKTIRSFLMVISAGVFCALGVSLITLYYFSPGGSYRVENILLSPSLLTNLSYPDVNPQTGKSVRYTFDRVELLFFDDEKGEWIRKELDVEQYRLIYSLISGEKGMGVIPENITSFFTTTDPMTLTLVVKREDNGSRNEETRVFQEIQIIPSGNYYRILMHDAQGNNWIYFYHENIYYKVLNLLNL